jgi:predicted RNase H-like HicB family nuclease
MAKIIYYGVMHKDKGSDYGVSFPDFPGCVAAESDFESAIVSAQEALSFHIKGMIEDGEAIPDPSKADAIKDDDAPIAIVPVEIEVPVLRVKRYNIAARGTDMRKIDQFLKSKGRNRDRSEFLIAAALREIDRQGKKHPA